MSNSDRPDGRAPNQLRPISFEAGIAPHATGSVLVSFGQTRVICAATLEPAVPGWMRAQNVSGGWLTAEYSMLPYSTHDRKRRDISKGKQDGRSVEIQRLIGRAMRAVVDLQKLGTHTLWVDCDVLQADGGTRTASITGAYCSLYRAFERCIDLGIIQSIPLIDSVAAISCGIYQGTPVLDLDYAEDSSAEADANFVLTGKSGIVEIQGTAEADPFSEEAFMELMRLAKKGIGELSALQTAALGK